MGAGQWSLKVREPVAVRSDRCCSIRALTPSRSPAVTSAQPSRVSLRARRATLPNPADSTSAASALFLICSSSQTRTHTKRFANANFEPGFEAKRASTSPQRISSASNRHKLERTYRDIDRI